jgi:SAM-dependent methyltransferase
MPDACIVCGQGRFVEYLRLSSRVMAVPMGLDRGLDAHAVIDRCAACGLLRTREGDMRPPAVLYAEQSISLTASHTKATQFGTRAIYSTDELTFLPASPGRLLDVGCSSGYFLAKARAAGWHTLGTELDVKAAALARATLDVDVLCGDVRELPLRPGDFDAVTMWGVLEHLSDPLGYLTHLANLITESGVIVVGVPNAASLNRQVSRLSRHGWDMFLEPGHLFHFTRRTLASLGKRAGLTIARRGTMTCAIRGKLPIIPTRLAGLERAVDRLDANSRTFSGIYRSLLRLLDMFRAGDILVVVFRKQATR